MTRISDVMKEDHKAMRDDYMKIVEAQDDDARARWGEQFMWDVARYSVAEALVVYPALEEHMDHGQIIADKDRNQNKQIKDLMFRLDITKGDDQLFRPTLDDLMKNLNKHIDEEEDEDLPSLESVIDPPESEMMSRRFEQTKMLMPTSAYEYSPEHPYFESPVDLMDAPVDRISDIMSRFPG